MTETNLAALVQEYVASDEPAFLLSPAEAVARGRRSLRVRRLAASGVAAVLVVGTALGATAFVDRTSTEGGQDVTTVPIEELPGVIEERATEVFSRSYPDLPEGHIGVFGEDGPEQLEPGEYDRAREMGVGFELPGVRLNVGTGYGIDSEGYERRICEERVDSGAWIECEVRTGPDGSVITTSVQAAWLQPDTSGTDVTINGEQLPQVGIFNIVSLEEIATLSDEKLDRLWFTHRVSVARPGNHVTGASEKVRARSLAEADAAWQVPWEDLEELAADPQLQLP